MPPSLLLLITLGIFQVSQPIKIPESHISLQLPNGDWHTSPETDTAKGVNFFKRDAVTDPEGQQVVPAIMVFVDDAKAYHGDVVQYSIVKRMPFIKNGLNIDQTKIQSDKGYPLTCKNALFMKGSYTQNGVAHTLYMVHLIDKYNEGIQVYLDMTKDLGQKYEAELLATVRSIREE